MSTKEGNPRKLSIFQLREHIQEYCDSTDWFLKDILMVTKFDQSLKSKEGIEWIWGKIGK